MRAWMYSSLVLLLACGGATDDSIALDGGLDAGQDGTTAPDVTVGPDTGTPDVNVGDAILLDVQSDVSTGPFDPSQIGSGLVLWLEGDKGVTEDTNNAGHVQTWADQTSYHNDATGTGHEPTIDATAINNLPAVAFANQGQSSQYLSIADSASLQLGSGDFAIFMVAEYTNPTSGGGAGQGMFYFKVAGTNTPTGPELIGNSGAANNTLESRIRARLTGTDNVNSSGTGYNDGKYHRIGIRRNGQALEVWADGTSTSFTPDAGAPGDVSATGSDVTIGAALGGNFPQYRLDGGIAEVVGVKGTFTDGDAAGLDAYFKTKYGL
jgi:hypothetical protein